MGGEDVLQNRPREQENTMSKKVLFVALLVAAVAACAKKEEVVYTEAPVTTEPTYDGKL
jgi:hypothetical protein